MFGHDSLISWKLRISRHASTLWRPCRCAFGSVGMLKYDWLKIAEIHVFAISVAVAAFVMADTAVSWTFLNQNCFWRWKLMYMGNQLIVISDPRPTTHDPRPTHPRRLDNLFEVDFFRFFRSRRLVNCSLLLKGSSGETIQRTGSGVQEVGQRTVKFTVIRYSIRQQHVQKYTLATQTVGFLWINI